MVSVIQNLPHKVGVYSCLLAMVGIEKPKLSE